MSLSHPPCLCLFVCLLRRGDWASAAQIASHMLVSPVILLGPVRRKPEKDPHTHNTRRYAATAVMKDKERDTTVYSPFIVRSTSPYNSSAPSPSPSSKVSNCLKDCASITDFSREHYLKLPRFFHNRIFAIRDNQTRAAAAAAAASAASAVTVADAAASVTDSPVVSDTRNNVDSSSSDNQQ